MQTAQNGTNRRERADIDPQRASRKPYFVAWLACSVLHERNVPMEIKRIGMQPSQRPPANISPERFAWTRCFRLPIPHA
jgi:hypothetical protein